MIHRGGGHGEEDGGIWWHSRSLKDDWDSMPALPTSSSVEDQQQLHEDAQSEVKIKEDESQKAKEQDLSTNSSMEHSSADICSNHPPIFITSQASPSLRSQTDVGLLTGPDRNSGKDG